MSNFENAKDIVTILAAPLAGLAGAWFGAQASTKQFTATNDDRQRERDHSEQVRVVEAAERAKAAEAERLAADKQREKERYEEIQESALVATAALRGEFAYNLRTGLHIDRAVVERFMMASARFTLVMGEQETHAMQKAVSEYVSKDRLTLAPDAMDDALAAYARSLAQAHYWDGEA
ncbi:hypothetical protein IEZ26_17800 [Nocardioides cavernae]|uniref:Uncharacterized protein n=1 Tax=Nocardioides cavernae TaxID=1921566 RepID=A0ABR8NEC6_9ACTN|nr:hypothetical protein [Nocardioides cavernae]MBD3926483.1 hypothetical protein [Nocardioides cavernae]MBM7512202.1 hypothetical protein [Nocardioides cavernae]